MYYLRNWLKKGVKNIMKSTLKSGLPASHRGPGMTCGSGIDDNLLSLVNDNRKGIGTKPKKRNRNKT